MFLLVNVHESEAPQMRQMTSMLAAVSVLLLACRPGVSQAQAAGVNMIVLLSNPEKFDGKIVELRGFLSLDHQVHHAPMAFLFLHEEDANNLLGNSILVLPSEQMVSDEEKINRMYVVVTGLVQVVHGRGNSYGLEMKDVRSCRLWSNPRRPIGLGVHQAPAADQK